MDKIIKTFRLMEKQSRAFIIPSVTQFSFKNDPYLVLISCLLSLRTKDKTTMEAADRLFQAANTALKMVKLSAGRIQSLIYPVGFYRNKAKFILGMSKQIINDFGGAVPDKLDDLLKLKGVGRKCANLVLGLGYNIPAICVDTHVHQISNRLGWLKTAAPEETEEYLKKIIPKRYWIKLNTILVSFGQNICVPVSPYCSKCFVRSLCKRIGVKRWR
jgi:endonuclease-3